jgi:hypothetical protein
VADKPYVNPMRRQFEELRAKHLSLAKYADYALANLNDVDPQEVLAKLPPAYLTLIRDTIARSWRLMPLVDRAVKAQCYIETLVLCHGVIQMSLRTLYVCAWQRTETRNLTPGEAEPYFRTGRGARSVHNLVNECRAKELIQQPQADLLLRVNELRNSAAHGIISGEVEPESLQEDVLNAQHATVGALHRLQTWTNNPCPFHWKRVWCAVQSPGLRRGQ